SRRSLHRLATTHAAVGARLQILEALDDDPQRSTLATAVLVFPLVQLQVPFDEHLLTLAERLQYAVGLLALASEGVPDLHVDEDWNLLPLVCVLVQLPVVHREAELRSRLCALRHDRFRIAGQPADQHHLVEVRHKGALLPGMCAVLKKPTLLYTC